MSSPPILLLAQVDDATGEVLRTIPSQEVRKALEALKASGKHAIDRLA